MATAPWTRRAYPGPRERGAIYRSFVGLIMFSGGEYRCVRHKHTGPVPDGRGRDEDFSSPTGSPEAVARPRLPQNVACGFPAPRSSAVGSQLSLLSVQVSFPWSADLLSEWKAVTPVAWSPCRPRTIQLPLTTSPCSRLSRPQSTISQSDFHPVIRPFSPLRLGRSYRLAPEPDGYFRPCGGSRLCLFPWHRRLGSHVPYKSLVKLRAIYMPDVARSVSGHPPN